jgi:16S rRNA (cytidine1402-2'-O)-methyltransferase
MLCGRDVVVESKPGTLTLAGAPIGRSDDAPARLAAELESADIVAAEDTRRVRRLAADLDVRISGRVVSYYDAIESRRAAELVRELENGNDVLVVTDAGMPAVSDPGYRLVAAAAAANIPVTAVPGPSAVTTALAVSGLPSDRFSFEGFPPRKSGERKRRFDEMSTAPHTQVYFESPYRVAVTLAELAQSHGGDRPAVVCRELTKTHEEIVRGTLADLARWASERSARVRGEITLVVAGLSRRIARTAGPDPQRPPDAGEAVQPQGAGRSRSERHRRR